MKYGLVLLAFLSIFLYLSSDSFLAKEKPNLNNLDKQKSNNAEINPLIFDQNKQKLPNKVETLNKSQINTDVSIEHEQVIYEDEPYITEVEISNVRKSNINIKFEDQEVDYDWAPDFTDKLFDLFSFHEKLTQHSVKDIECRATLCLLQFYIDEHNSIEQAITIGKVLQSDDWKEHSLYLHGHPEPGVMTIEIGRFKD